MGAAILRLLIGGGTLALASTGCAAHVATGADAFHPGYDAVLASVLVAATLLYARGVTRLWRKAGVGRGIHVVDAIRFALGMIALAAALLSPIDALADRSFAMHMIEHEMLMVLAAPLFVVSRPLEAWTWGLGRDARHRVAGVVRASVLERYWHATTAPVPATCVHALALWTWHVPLFFAAALARLPMHVLQHACFFASALAFWWAMFGGATRSAGIVSLACLFATMLHTSVLGALLTFAPYALYVHGAQPPVFGLSPLEDQQLGGLIMWVPGGLAYIVGGLAIVASWLGTPPLRRSVR
jgi:putative membrane protein